ncbi:hypothetical protein POM88_035810 [Heracleum sosnowskyi]|uniref:Uncharacterized protein n=1 Tax=Heracleum sosnowskyi TaxID=360622 RepID=A0AAD8HNX9_9APIA|nr:hypothetical protein POM88_035810 [Heracleum sosnowskyi]
MVIESKISSVVVRSMDKKYGVCFAVCFGFFSEENGYRQSVPYCLSESKISSVVVRSMDKKYVVENLLNELSSYHGAVIRQMKQMVELYIKLAELETKEVPVVTSTFPIDRSCSYHEDSFAHFKGLADSVTVINGINISHAFFGTFWLIQYEKLLGVLETGIFPYFMMVHYVDTELVVDITSAAPCTVNFSLMQEGDAKDFNLKLKASKQELLFSSEESTEYIYTAVVKLQIGLVLIQRQQLSSEPVIPTADQLSWLYVEWSCIKRLPIAYEFVGTNMRQLHVRVKNYHRLLQLCMSLSPSLLAREITQNNLYLIGRIEEAKLLRAQGQHEMAINLTKTMFLPLTCDYGAARGLYWEKYLKHAVTLAEDHMTTDKKSMGRQSQTHCHLAHYADALLQLEALIRRLKSSSKGDKTDYSIKIQELQKQLPMDREEAEQLQARYKHCLVIGDKYDIRVVFRLISLWFKLGGPKDGQGAQSLQDTNKKVTLPRDIRSLRQLERVPVVSSTFPIDRSCQYHEGSFAHFKGLADSVTVMNGMNAPKVLSSDGNIMQLFRFCTGINISHVFFGTFWLMQYEKLLGVMETGIFPYFMMVHYVVFLLISLWFSLSTKPIVVNAMLSTINEGSMKVTKLPQDWVAQKMAKELRVSSVMNGINAPKVVECLGYDGNKYRQLAKSGNDDLRQDAENEKAKAFQEVCKNFRPVMHYFFLERFLHASDWFEKGLLTHEVWQLVQWWVTLLDSEIDTP